MFEEFLCEALGFIRPAGILDSEATLRRYVELGGRVDGDIGYYKLLAAFVLPLVQLLKQQLGIKGRATLLALAAGLVIFTLLALATSAILAALVRKVQPDLVICGMASTDGAMGVVPAMVAELLGVPTILVVGRGLERGVLGQELGQRGAVSPLG